MNSVFAGVLESPAGLALVAGLAAAGVYGVTAWAAASAGGEHLLMGLLCLAGAGFGAAERRRRLLERQAQKRDV